MVSSVAGLTEGVIKGSTIINCAGIFDKVEPNPKCWGVSGRSRRPECSQCPEVSCNSFFYEVGYDLGLDENGEYCSDLGVKKIKKYAEEFGLGETTGIEIPESSPQISDTASVPTAIGQGYQTTIQSVS